MGCSGSSQREDRTPVLSERHDSKRKANTLGCVGKLFGFRKARYIKKAEERAVTLAELEQVRGILVERCVEEQWEDFLDGGALDPKEVNLYALNHYLICPSTVPKGVLLRGLEKRDWRQGERLLQRQMAGTGQALVQGTVRKPSNGSDVLVDLCQGQFKVGLRVEVDDKSVGQVASVTAVNSLSYKEVMSREPLLPTWLVSHWWGEPVVDFVSCCSAHSSGRDLCGHQASYWVCAYSNRQHDLEQDIAENPEDTSFNIAMDVSCGVLLILDPSSRPFRRIWCVFELQKVLKDKSKLLDIATMHDGNARLLSEGTLPGEEPWQKKRRELSFPMALLADGMHQRLEQGEASVEMDKVRVLNCITGRSISTDSLNDRTVLERLHDAKSLDMAYYDRMNHALHSRFALAAWPQAIKQGLVADFDRRRPGQVSLPRILKTDQSLTDFQLDLQTFEEVTDKDLERIADAVSANVTNLDLNLAMCSKVTPKGVTNLASHLPRELRRLRLRLGRCPELTDHAIKVLALQWSQQLEELELSVKECKGITDDGVMVVAKHLPGSLRRLSLNFRGCDVTDRAVFAIASTLPRSLETLELDIETCHSVTVHSIIKLKESLPQKVSKLLLSTRGTQAGRTFDNVEEFADWTAMYPKDV